MYMNEAAEKQEFHTLLVGMYTASLYKEGNSVTSIRVTNAPTL